MDDLISRQAVIDAVLKIEKITKHRSDFSDLDEFEPSEQRWIPVSEKMPNGQELVIVSCHDTSGDTSFDYTSSAWTTTDGEYWIVDNEINPYVVAWMELPTPWKGGK